MELIIGIILIVIILYIVLLLLRFVIAPVLTVVTIVSVVSGSVISIFMYIRAALEYMNPYELPEKVYTRTEKDVYVYHGKKAEENVKRRSYFFGPGFYSLWKTWITSWMYNYSVVKIYWDWMNAKRNSITSDILRYAVTVIFWTGLIGVGVSVLIVGGAVSIGIGLIHAVIMLIVMAAVYIVYSILYGIDHLYLWRHSITSICPRCKSRFIVPVFQCSNCGAKHKRLIPSPYGIWTHQCKCGAVLPATFFNGRSQLESFCPYCEDERIASSSSRQFCISLIGGSSSGKTTLLASYLHLAEKRFADVGLSVEIPDECKKKIERLEHAYQNAEQLPGTQLADYTDPYTLILSGNGMNFTRQFNIFDVAGETFESPDLGGIPYGQDFADSEGIMIVVDPLSSLSLRQQVASRGASVTTASLFDPALVVNNLANYLRQVATKTGQKIARPTAVVLTKTDLPVIESEISGDVVAREMGLYPGDAMVARDNICRQFLNNNGFSTFLMALDANFSNTHFFAVSATGGAKPGESYHADAFLEGPFNWLISSSGDVELAQAMNIPVQKKDMENARPSGRKITESVQNFGRKMAGGVQEPVRSVAEGMQRFGRNVAGTVRRTASNPPEKPQQPTDLPDYGAQYSPSPSETRQYPDEKNGGVNGSTSRSERRSRRATENAPAWTPVPAENTQKNPYGTDGNTSTWTPMPSEDLKRFTQETAGNAPAWTPTSTEDLQRSKQETGGNVPDNDIQPERRRRRRAEK